MRKMNIKYGKGFMMTSQWNYYLYLMMLQLKKMM